MATQNTIALLNIRTVPQGLYQGFNPVVAVITKFIVLLLAVFLVVWPEASGRILEFLKTSTLSIFAGWYIYLLAAFLVACLGLAILPVSGRVTLGPEGVLPEHSTLSWLAMMFCSGIGIGILVFSVSEPVSHFLENPDSLAGSMPPGADGQVASAMRFVFLHWGFSAWACYAIVGLALGLACHRYGQPLTMRSGVAAIFGKRLEGPVGHAIDIIAILAIIAGITTTIVLGLEQISAGLAVLTGSPFFANAAGAPPLTALLTALVVSTSIAIASVVSGVDRGVKWTSQFGIVLVFGVLAAFIIFGGGTRVFSVLTDGTLAYFRTLPTQITTIYDPGPTDAAQAQHIWQSKWTIFYWAWWIAFAPFVGLFLARISRGRTIREFIIGAVLGPTAMCFVWFAGTGGSALLLEQNGVASGSILSAEHAFRIYATVDVMLTTGWAIALKAVLVLLFLVLIVASSTAAIIAIKSIGAGGGDFAETPSHSVMWAFVIAALTGAVMAVGGVGSVRDFMIVAAVPFSLVMALMLVAVVIMITASATEKQDHSGAAP